MFEIRFSKSAGKYINKLDRVTRARIKKSLLKLSENPQDTDLDVSKLRGYQDSFRLRIGKYKALYKIIKHEIVIFVFETDSRGDVYK